MQGPREEQGGCVGAGERAVPGWPGTRRRSSGTALGHRTAQYSTAPKLEYQQPPRGYKQQLAGTPGATCVVSD